MGNTSQKAKILFVSPQLIKLFIQYITWSDQLIRQRLINDNKISIPIIKPGVILSHLVDNPAINEAIGIEMEMPSLFVETQHTKTNIIIVKQYLILSLVSVECTKLCSNSTRYS